MKKKCPIKITLIIMLASITLLCLKISLKMCPKVNCTTLVTQITVNFEQLIFKDIIFPHSVTEFKLKTYQ